MADRAPTFTSCVRESVTTDSRSIYTSGDITEDVTLVHDGDAFADCLIAIVKGGKLSPQAVSLPRLVPVRFRLAPNMTILAQASASSGDRAVLIFATQLAEESSMEEELFNIRCLLQQIAFTADKLVSRLEIK